MYLMNVPPVAATQTEWRTCGPPGGYSLPVCFNDSDTELSTRGTPISDKVQMIIESLRTSQSSLEMGDEIEGNGLSEQEGHPQVCKVAVGSYAAARPKTKSPAELPQDGVSSPVIHETTDSDSDDSVDRGIEEAILEYLKEKDDHKRKGEPCSEFLQSSKIHRKSPLDPEVSMQNSDSNTFSFAASQFAKCVKAESHATPAVIPIKKYIKSKASLNDGTFESFDLTKNATKNFPEQTKSFSTAVTATSKTVSSPVGIKIEEESSDSSSDDGIEEAIQRYQLEQKEQLVKREPFNTHAFDDESDSTSDDGIEEAIRCYQLEQLKEKSPLKSFLQQKKSFSKSLLHSVGSASTENTKKHKLKKKKASADRQVKSSQPALSGFLSKTTLSESSKDKGNGLHSFKFESFRGQPTPAAPKVNTSAELMCAEAILDISKTVMPGPFQQTAGLSSCAATKSSLPSSLPDNCPDDESNDSSIDSEDGIEQEIRKFLEQKAQMQKQPPDSSSASAEPRSVCEQDKVTAKESVCLKKPQKLSLTQRKKLRETNSSVSGTWDKVDTVQEKANKPLPAPAKESNPLMLFQSSQTHPVSGLSKAEQSGDKSSSLDSDEDLDNAIKDLLKTKKKSKKKVRDLKRKSRKCLKDAESLSGNALPVKKLKPDSLNKCNPLKRAQKSKDGMKDKFGLSEMSVSQQKQILKSKDLDMLENEKEILKGARLLDVQTLPGVEASPHTKDDSSSVDSDDSIELEIRRFLAEKAKVSTAGRSHDEDASVSGTGADCNPLHSEDIKQENQLAEIPRKCINPVSGLSPHDSPARSRPPLPAWKTSPQDIAIVGGQSRLPSVPSRSPSLLEPADGAGAARTEQKRLITGNVGPQVERARPVFSPSVADSRSESIKWRQSLGLPIPAVRAPGRTPFQITSSDIGEPASASPYQSGGVGHKSQTPSAVWSFARTGKAPFPCSTETAVNTTYRSTVLNLFSTAKQRPRVSFSQSLTPGHRSQCSADGERERTVHISKDKSVYVELESNRTNHVQVQSRDRIEGKQREGQNMKIEQHLERKEEEFKDETDCESANRRNPEKTQGFPTL
ncbi:protein phosphatase 1 regulatory subunit 26 [Salarias fasciatus]|uniref:protein phosphatase 1 regulatory subunit 26 n=1 Tax=Salarias fasciatus TaxID=181472 RepID=UPI001176BD19|nr:protein phosphatase 1 regulatory subunit 26 [Salarias fasciatus]